MTAHKLAAGSGYTYLTRHVAMHDSTERAQVGLAAYYEEKGESPGRWLGGGLAGLDLAEGDIVTEEQMKLLFGQGRHPLADQPDASAHGWGALGRAFPTYAATSLRQATARAFSDHNTSRGLAWNHPIPADERAWIRTEVALEAFVERHGREPVDATEFSGFLAASSRPEQTAVAGYDLTFSPVKSVSTLWAIAPPEVAQEIAAAHKAAVRTTVALLEREVAFTRVGTGGIRQVPVTGLVAAAFDHRDSRAGDPDLHTHLVVSNKVQTLPSEGGRWLTLDGRMLFKAKVMASEHYNTRLEAELVDRLGVRFVDRYSPGGRRPVREIEGVDTRLLEAWSSRRRAIEDRQRGLAARFLAEHGRTPTAIESLALAQQANLETRPAKHEPYAASEQRARWRDEARSLVDYDYDRGEEHLDWVVSRALGLEGGRSRGGRGDEPGSVVAARVLEALEGSRATWQVWHVKAEALRQARAAEVPLAGLDEYVDRLVRHVVEDLSVRVGEDLDLGEPEALRRPGGESAYTVHGSAAYTSTRILDAERRLLELAGRADGRVIGEGRVRVAVADAARVGVTLDPSQAEMVRRLATSGRRLQVALAPAGSGKTTALAVLTRAWQDSGGTVIGLAPTAVAAEQLGKATGAWSDTLAKLVHELARAAANPNPPVRPIKALFAAEIGPRTLVLVDEAAMAGTADLAAVVSYAIDRGASVRLVGDDQQLGSVAAGGVFRDLADLGHLHGTTVRLTELHRFADPAEGAATLGVRDGDPAALDFYLDHGRVHAGNVETVADEAYAAWLADVAAGRSSLLLAPTRDMVRQLNERAREERLAESGGPVGREAALADGTRASRGDVVITRQNDRRLRTPGGTWVKNGDRWTVLDVDGAGAATVERLGHHRARPGARLVLPAAYVHEHLQLGYASTIHGAQGATVDTTHTVLTGAEDRQSLYVAVSRGRQENHVYVGSPAARLDGVGLDPETAPVEARDVLASILGRDGRPQSATTTQRGDAAAELRDVVLRYRDALPVLAEHVLGDDRMTGLDESLERWYPGLTSQTAYPGLRGRIAARWADGDDPSEVLRSAAWPHEMERLAQADDPAAVLAGEVGEGAGLYDDGPLPWLPSIPRAVRDDPEAAAYLERVVARIDELKERVIEEVLRPTVSESTPWLRALPADADPHLVGDLAIWRAAQGVPGTDVNPTGPPASGWWPEKHQSRLDRRLKLAVDPDLRREVDRQYAAARAATVTRTPDESWTPSRAAREATHPEGPSR